MSPPAADAEIRAVDDLFRAEPYTIWFRIFSIETVTLRSPALSGATSLTCAPLPRPLTSGFRIWFSDPGFSVKLTSNALAGATSIAVAAIPGPIPVGAFGRRQLDAGTIALSWTLEPKQPNVISPVLLTKAPTTIADPTDQDGTPFNLAVVSKTALDLAAVAPGVYVQRLVRTDTGRCLAQGDVVLKVR